MPGFLLTAWHNQRQWPQLGRGTKTIDKAGEYFSYAPRRTFQFHTTPAKIERSSLDSCRHFCAKCVDGFGSLNMSLWYLHEELRFRTISMFSCECRNDKIHRGFLTYHRPEIGALCTLARWTNHDDCKDSFLSWTTLHSICQLLFVDLTCFRARPGLSVFLGLSS